jgi:carbon storage regulator
MLVLSRRTDERIVLPTLETIIQVVSARPGLVRLGVDAPDSVPVFREEVWERLDDPERARLKPLAQATPEQLREQVLMLSEALSAAASDLAVLRRQISLWRTEELAAALDRVTWDLRSAQKQATRAEPPSPSVTVASGPDLVVY